MTPELQKILEEAIRQGQASSLPSSLVYVVVATLVSAVGGLWVYYRTLSSNLQESKNQIIGEQKDRIKGLEEQVKTLSDLRSLETSKDTLMKRVDDQQRLFEQLRQSEIEVMERRFNEMVEQNTKLVTAINESTSTIRLTMDGDEEVTDALKALDQDIQTCLRIQEEIRRSLDDLKRSWLTNPVPRS